VAAAIANAVADALGVRVRTLPLTPENLLRAVHAAESA
jgi:CO/xanthine dehydrogenase Mo-binding subunit